MAAIRPDTTPPPVFEALIVPHRSLSARGVRYLALFFLIAGVVLAVRFWLWGAWPIMAFSGVEAVAMVGLLYLNVRGSRASELILLHDDRLRVIRTDASGARAESELSVGWMNVMLEERPGRVPRLSVGSRAAREEIGAALGEDAKRDLARALMDALHTVHNPKFDNPQLHDA